MPIYDYRCLKCGEIQEVTVPVDERDTARRHACGGSLKRLLSLPQPPIIKPTGKGMAEDTLNSGHALPDRWYTKKHLKGAAKGLEKPPKRVW